jgi:hypothetical protein
LTDWGIALNAAQEIVFFRGHRRLSSRRGLL